LFLVFEARTVVLLLTESQIALRKIACRNEKNRHVIHIWVLIILLAPLLYFLCNFLLYSFIIRVAVACFTTLENGWGRPFVYFWDSTVTVLNKAKNGRSDSSFRKEGLWQQIMDEASEGVMCSSNFATMMKCQ
jgi:hypothetical protein